MSKHSKLQRELLDIQSPTYSRKAEKEIKKWKTLNSRKSKQIKNLRAAAPPAPAPATATAPVKPMSGLEENLLSDMEIRLSGFENWIVADLFGDEIKIPGRALPELSRIFPDWESRV